MISPRGGRLQDERLRGDSDPEEEALQPSFAVSSSGQPRQRRRTSSVQTGLTRQTSVRVQASGAATSAPAAVQPPSQDLIGLEEGVGLAPASPPPQPVPQHDNSLWRRHGRNNSVHGPVAGTGAAGSGGTGDGNLGAEKRVKLENEAPIRGLAKEMSWLEIPPRPKKPTPPHHRHSDSNGGNNNTAGSWLMGGHIRVPSRTQPTVHATHPSALDEPAAAVAPAPAPASGSVLPPAITLPGVLEAGGLGGNASKHGGGAGHGSFDPVESGIAPGKGGGAGGPVGPETPPPLRGLNRRDSLVPHRGEEEPPEDIEQELMIGEIKNISLNEEVVLVRRALVIIVLSVLAAVLVREFVGPVAEGTDLNIIYLVGFVAALLLSFPVIRFMVRLFAYTVTTRASSVLYRGNRYYFVVALHYDIAITVWSIFSVVFWREMFHEWVYTAEEHVSVVVHDYGDKILQCHMALRVGILVKNFVVLLVATSYLWRPYLRRVQSSILAQYILLLLTDYCTKGVCNSDDQKFALEMGKQGIQGKKNISLYAVSKAMGFIPRNKLGHSFFREIGGSDTLDSSKDATLLGNFLFEQLLLRSREFQSPPPRRDMTLAAQGGSDPGPTRLRVRERFNSSPTQRTWGFTMQKRNIEPITRSFFFQPPSAVAPADTVDEHHSGAESGVDKSVVGGAESTPDVRDKLLTSLNKLFSGGGSQREFGTSHVEPGGVGRRGAGPDGQVGGALRGGLKGGKGGREAEENGRVQVVIEGSERSTVILEGTEDATDGDCEEERKDPEKGNTMAGSGPQPPPGTADNGNHDGSMEERGEDDSMSTSSEEGEDEPEVLERKTFCPALHPDLKVAFKIFDLDHNGTITREEMVLGVVGTFKDHRSLALTLQDSEHIARKLGLIIMAIIMFILMFVCLSIWGADVVQLSVTFASFLIAISFMIGTAASNLVTSVLFIFITRVYDVGDRVLIYDSSQTTSAPTDLCVVKIDLLTTAFKRWDEQVFYMPNYLLASKTIVNIQRSAHQWHEFWIQIAAGTPTRKIKALHTWLQKFAKSKDKAEGLYSRMGFSLSNIENTNRLTIRITFRQRGNWQSLEKKWACRSMCTWAIKNGCDSIGISYSLPEVPIKVKDKLN